MYVTYLAMLGIFGYGMPYTMMTRTPFRRNMLFIGVPPKDVYDRLVQKSDGKTPVDRKREEVARILQDDQLLQEELNNRIAEGEFDLDKLAAASGTTREACRTQP